MKLHTKIGLFAASLFAAPGVAQADDGKGFTLDLGVGLAGLSDPDLTFVESGFDGILGNADDNVVATELDTKSASGFHGGFGYDFGNVRVAVHGSYSRHKVKSIAVKSINGAAVSSLDGDDIDDFADFVFDDSDLDASDVTISGNRFSLTNGGTLAKVRNVAVTADVFYDIPTGSKFTPYVGAGIGVGGQHIKIEGQDEGFTKLTWKLAAGASYAISDKAAISLDYSYRQTGKGKLIGADEDFETRVGKTKTHSFGVSLRLTF